MDSRKKAPIGKVRKEAETPFTFRKALEKLIQGVSVRSRDIIRARFGVSEKDPKTLEEIGKEYGITRERVRQIIRSVMKEVQSNKQDVLFAEAAAKIVSTLEAKSGIMEETELLETLGGSDFREAGSVRFFLECLPNVVVVKEDDEMERSYRLDTFRLEDWQRVKISAKQLLEKENRLFERQELIDALAFSLPEHALPGTLMHFLAIAKEIQANVFGKWGLASWSDVQPKGTREKAYLVLKMSAKPLHFRDIAQLIDQHGLQKDKKKTHPQTVHNELIKDKRFVLVGRGTYALSEWGYRRGTVKEVVESILAESVQPMKRSDIIKKVLEVRKVKKSTIVINLNAFFARVGKDEYVLKR